MLRSVATSVERAEKKYPRLMTDSYGTVVLVTGETANGVNGFVVSSVRERLGNRSVNWNGMTDFIGTVTLTQE